VKIADKRAANKDAHKARERKSKSVEAVVSPGDELIAGEAREKVVTDENLQPCPTD
jgi:hypothetical protein